MYSSDCSKNKMPQDEAAYFDKLEFVTDGSGGYANVWLCCDEKRSGDAPRYVAVKIIMAEVSTPDCPELRINKLVDIGIEAYTAAEHFCLPLDQFSIDGPNGTHFAFVYPVLGPRVSRLFNKVDDDDMDVTLRKMAAQVTRAMSVLHKHGICHGGRASDQTHITTH